MGTKWAEKTEKADTRGKATQAEISKAVQWAASSIKPTRY
jgi:hypothetical protein